MLNTLRLPPTIITITTLLLSHFSFFALGNSNAISSIDLSNAYNGVSGYNVIAVGLLLFAGNWAGPVWWAAAGVCLLLEKEGGAAAEVEKSRDGSDGSRNWVREERERLHLAALVSGKAEPSEKDAGKDAFGEVSLKFTYSPSLSLHGGTYANVHSLLNIAHHTDPPPGAELD